MLRNWLARRRANRQRLIFEYWNGDRLLKADPYRLYRDMWSHPGFRFHSEEALGAVQAGEEPEFTDCVNAVCDVFGCRRLDPITGEGFTDAQVIDLLQQYDEFCEAAAGKLDGGPTSSTPTDGEPSSAKAAQCSTTNSHLAFGGYETAPPASGPEPFPGGCKTPLAG